MRENQADVTQFMQKKLKLEMSQEKTLITNAQDSAKIFSAMKYQSVKITQRRKMQEEKLVDIVMVM
mgnify:CR=1 FL=1